MRPTISEETIEKLCEVMNCWEGDTDLDLDKMVDIVRTDPSWELASPEQIIHFLTDLMEGLA